MIALLVVVFARTRLPHRRGVLAGALQIALAVAGSRNSWFIPRSVMIGFVNALAILIFTAQLRHLFGVPWAVYPLVAAVSMIVFIPKLTTAVPAALIAIVVLTGVVVSVGLDVPDVADQGELPGGFPTWMIPDAADRRHAADRRPVRVGLSSSGSWNR